MASGEWRVTSGANSIFSNRRVAEKTEEVNIKLCASLRLCGSIVSTAETPRKIKRKNFAPLCAFAVKKIPDQHQNESTQATPIILQLLHNEPYNLPMSLGIQHVNAR